MADRHAAKPATRPALRSVPLVIRQPDTPSAMIKRTAVLDSRLRKLASERKLGRKMLTSAAISRMPTMMARSLMKRSTLRGEKRFHRYCPRLRPSSSLRFSAVRISPAASSAAPRTISGT